MEQKKTVSVIVPVYNAEKFLRRCIDSIFAQSYADMELVAVNDGSKDNSLSILQEYARQDRRIKIADQENRGVAAARNAGLQKATGEFILYVDADDWIAPDMISRMVELSHEADIVFCGHDFAETAEEAKCAEKAEIEEWDAEKQRLEFMKHKRMTGMLWNKLIRRSITEGISFNEKTGYGEDAEFLWQVLKRSEKMVVTNEILYHHVMEENSISHLSYSEKKYSAIPMWERICEEAERDHPELLPLAKERLMCAAVFGMYEAKACGYGNRENIAHMRKIVRKNLGEFLRASHISKKFKLYAMAVCLGY